MSHSITQELDRLEAVIHQIAGRPFDVDDPTQLGEVLFDEMGLAGGVRQEDGRWDTRPQTLERIENDDCPVVSAILDLRWMRIVRELLDGADGQPWAFAGFIQDYITSFGDYEIQRADGSTVRASALLTEVARTAVLSDGTADLETMRLLRRTARPASNTPGAGRHVH